MKRPLFSMIGLAAASLLIAACGEPSPVPAVTPIARISTPAETKPSSTETRLPSLTPYFTETPSAGFTSLPAQTPWPLSHLGPIAYVTYDDEVQNDAIWLVDPLTQVRQRVYGNTTPNSSLLYSLSWSPNGLYLAFVKSFGGPADIFILDVANQNAWNITNTSDVSEMQPAWSPDGRTIAFVVRSKADGPHYFSNIHVMNADGSAPRQLTECITYCEQPSWSPSGDLIAYMSDFQISVMNSDGSNSRQITHGGMNETPVWSPDGQQIAFIRAVETLTEGYLYLMKPDGTNLAALTDGNAKVFSELAWSPDGRFIAFRNNPKNGSMGIYVIDIRTGGTRMVTGYPAFAPSWYPPLTTSTGPGDVDQLPDCTNGWTRLTAGGQARVGGVSTDPPNRVRSEPAMANNIIGYIYPGVFLQVIQGPVCADGLVFWRVENSTIPGGSGWTAEGDGTEYWLEPYE